MIAIGTCLDGPVRNSAENCPASTGASYKALRSNEAGLTIVIEMFPADDPYPYH